jgi:CheY-like chemotaxis protein
MRSGLDALEIQRAATRALTPVHSPRKGLFGGCGRAQPRLCSIPRAVAILSCKAMDVHPKGAETILIVDDDDLVRTSAAALIGSLGYRVLSAGNGPQALEVLQQDTPIDLLFTDIFMPGGMHGPQLVAAARRLRPELKILFTSGYFEYAEVRHALDPSIEQVSKPYERDVLAAILRRTLSARGGAAADRRTNGEAR